MKDLKKLNLDKLKLEWNTLKIIIITKNLYCATNADANSAAHALAIVKLGTKQMCLQHTLETQQSD